MQVYKGLYRGVREVAVKVVSSPDPVAQARFVQEIATLREMRDPNIILFMGASVQAGKTLLLMQFMQHGNLWEALRRNTDGSFGWYQGSASTSASLQTMLTMQKRYCLFSLSRPAFCTFLDIWRLTVCLCTSHVLLGNACTASVGLNCAPRRDISQPLAAATISTL